MVVAAPDADRPRGGITSHAGSVQEIVRVPPGGALQAALDRARPGAVIELAAGGIYTGPFRLPRKTGDQEIVIRSERVDSPEFAAVGQRVRPEMAPHMAVLTASSGAVITSEPGAHHYRFVGLEIRPPARVALTNLVELGASATTIRDLPHDIVFDRCYVHGDPERGSRRGLALNTGRALVIDSHLSDFKRAGEESQAIAVWNGTGPFTILNSYLEATGENVMFGGADPLIPDLVPADIVIRGNHFSKPVAWRRSGAGWTVKNLFELKNARNVTIEGNLFEHNWPDAQTGFAILFTPRNQDGAAPWTVVEDVTFTGNLVRRVGGGISILGTDDIQTSRPTARVRISNNLFIDVGGEWGGGTLFQIMHGTTSVHIAHNTALQTGTAILAGDTTPHRSFTFENNLVLHNEYGIIGSDAGIGRGSIDRYFPNAAIRNNVLVGAPGGAYPPGTFNPSSIAAVGFEAPDRGDYRLATGSRFRGAATDGGDIGADVAAIGRAARQAESGRREISTGLSADPCITVAGTCRQD